VTAKGDHWRELIPSAWPLHAENFPQYELQCRGCGRRSWLPVGELAGACTVCSGKRVPTNRQTHGLKTNISKLAQE
jgi:hypothetical protein